MKLFPLSSFSWTTMVSKILSKRPYKEYNTFINLKKS